MPEKEFTTKLTKLIQIADKIVQDVEEAMFVAHEVKEEMGKIKERFTKPGEEDDERLGES